MKSANRQPLSRASIAVLLLMASAVTALGQRTLATREIFYVGGKYVQFEGREVMTGQMYVEVLRPEKVTQKYPILLVHSASSAALWMGTPDGRPGWADYFLGQGYVVYLPDQPARGRSAWHAGVNSPLAPPVPKSRTEQQNTIPEQYDVYPQAKKHTQWPGKGRTGDPIFDAFYAGLLDGLSDGIEGATMFQEAGQALLDRIGPVILLTHSQSGPYGWALADSRPNAVKGIVAIEPTGPPFRNAIVNGGNENEVRPWGLTAIPLNYSPPIQTPAELHPTREPNADGPHLAKCWTQGGSSPRQLPNLSGIPILIASGEASYHTVYDHCTAKYLRKAGAKNTTHLRLEDAGVRGNAHFMMLEKNNLEVAAALHKWIQEHIE